MARFTDEHGEQYLFTWSEALDYAFSEGKFIPSKEQARELNLPSGLWTSTTDKHESFKAYVTRSNKSISKHELRTVNLVDKLESKQEISYRVGDTENYNK